MADAPEAGYSSEVAEVPAVLAQPVPAPAAPQLPAVGPVGKPPTLTEMLHGKSTDRRSGVQLRDAKREKANHDLLYRSEYLATLVSNVAVLESSPVQQLQQTLAASPVTHLISASTSRHLSQTLYPPVKTAHPSPQTARPSPQTARPHRMEDLTGGSFRPQAAPAAIWALETSPITRGRAAFARGTSTYSRGGTRLEDPLARYLNVWETYGDVSADIHYQTGEMLRKNLVSSIPTDREGRELEDTIAPNPLDALKIPHVPGLQRDSHFGDHADHSELEVARHASRCRHVARLKEEDMAETSNATLQFARHYWSNRTRNEELAEQGLQELPCSSFRRMDGQDNSTATHKFTLMECGGLLMRLEGRDPFHSHALVTMERPVQVRGEGHYFEIQVVSLFRTPGRPDRPKELEKRNRTEGLVIGMTTTPPSECTAQMRSVTDVPMAWCVATSGKYYAAETPAEQPKRPVNQERIKTAPPWHRRVGQSEQLRCCWPPVPHTAGMVRRKLDWSFAMGEGDTLGMLITPFGGIVITVNGERQVFLPDAGVPMGGAFYPLVEAYNHVRSVRVLPGALPPK